MFETSQFTNKFKVAGIRKQRAEDEEAIRRQRPTLVCNQCRTSKLRYDKARPCGSCVKRDGGGSCSYDSALRGSNKPATEDRLDRLEAMVTQLMDIPHAPRSNLDPNTPPSLPDDQVRVNDGRGRGRGIGIVKDQYPIIVEEIMDSIHQLRLELPVPHDEPDFEAPITGGESTDDECIFGLSTPYSRNAILSQYMKPNAF